MAINNQRKWKISVMKIMAINVEISWRENAGISGVSGVQ
jgi:hypothetical protein